MPFESGTDPRPGSRTGSAGSRPERPTRTRYRVAGFLFLLAGVTYLDRICISTLAPYISRDLGLTKMQMGVVFSAFAVSYAAFEILSAWWGERVGARRVLTRIVTWWSVFTMATAASWNYASLLAIRFLFGAGEAGAWPNATLAFSRWIPARERGRVQGLFFAAAHLAGGVTPFLVIVLLTFLPWRGVFLVCGAVGLLWAVAWSRWFRDEPRDHPEVNPAEAELIESERRLARHSAGGRPLGRLLLASPNVWLLCLAYFSNCYGSYFVMTWLPTYLAEYRGFEHEALGVVAGLPLVLSVIGDVAGGTITDSLARRFGLRFGRVAVSVVGYALASAAMFVSIWSSSAAVAAGMIAVAIAASMFTLAATWAACMDIGGDHSAVVSATMNTAGQIGSILSPLAAGWLVTRFSDWQLPLLILAVLYAVSAILWLFVNPGKRVL
ncbi:MAG: MFS transporter [Bryobacterales bacterium]|nr:MFS transporter [Bryobacterales bacterium]